MCRRTAIRWCGGSFACWSRTASRKKKTALATGLTAGTINSWRLHSPGLVNFEMALNAVGYRLAIVKLLDADAADAPEDAA